MYTLATVLPSIELTLEINVSAYQVPFSLLQWISKWSTLNLLYIGSSGVRMPRWVVALIVSLAVSKPIFHFLANSLSLTFEWCPLLLTYYAVLLCSISSMSFLLVKATHTEPIKLPQKNFSWYKSEYYPAHLLPHPIHPFFLGLSSFLKSPSYSFWRLRI